MFLVKQIDCSHFGVIEIRTIIVIDTFYGIPKSDHFEMEEAESKTCNQVSDSTYPLNRN